MAGVAPARRDRCVVHHVRCEAGRRIVVAEAALDAADRNMRRRRVAGRRRSVVAGHAIRVRRLMYVDGAREARIAAAHGGGMTGHAVAAGRSHVSGII